LLSNDSECNDFLTFDTSLNELLAEFNDSDEEAIFIETFCSDFFDGSWESLSELNDDAIPEDISLLYRLFVEEQSSDLLNYILNKIFSTQSRCQFYNYEIAQSPLPVISCLQAASFNSQARVTIVTDQQPIINFIQPSSTIGNNFAAEGSNIKIQQNVQNVTDQDRTKLQALLIQLAQTYPVNTEPQKQTFIQKFLERIESTPDLVKVLLVGGIEWVKIIDPAVGIPIEMLRRLYQAVEERHNQP
jgi:hypothetical protein